jgi:hypothetical protein
MNKQAFISLYKLRLWEVDISEKWDELISAPQLYLDDTGFEVIKMLIFYRNK